MTQLVGPNAVYTGGQTCIQQIIPAYVYEQYADDDNIQAFTIAQNNIAEQYRLWFATLNLPIYTGGVVAGALLDWVGLGLYGIRRPSVTTGVLRSFGAMDSFPMNVVAMNGRRMTSTLANQLVSDDIYRRVLTWDLYKGDGFTFNTQWLKRRVLRFLNGPNGISPVIDQTYAVSVTVTGTTYTIAVPSANSTTVALLNALINSGACITPFQYSFSVSTVLGPTGFSDNGGSLTVTDATGYPTSPAGLMPGAVWNNGSTVAVVPGITPNPAAPPVVYGNITAAQLLALGGGNFPLSNPGIGTFIFWNNGGSVSIA